MFSFQFFRVNCFQVWFLLWNYTYMPQTHVSSLTSTGRVRENRYQCSRSFGSSEQKAKIFDRWGAVWWCKILFHVFRWYVFHVFRWYAIWILTRTFLLLEFDICISKLKDYARISMQHVGLEQWTEWFYILYFSGKCRIRGMLHNWHVAWSSISCKDLESENRNITQESHIARSKLLNQI